MENSETPNIAGALAATWQAHARVCGYLAHKKPPPPPSTAIGAQSWSYCTFLRGGGLLCEVPLYYKPVKHPSEGARWLYGALEGSLTHARVTRRLEQALESC